MKKKLFFLLSTNFLVIILLAQTQKTFCNQSPKDTFYVKIASQLHLHSGDTLADIGAGMGYTIVRIAHYMPGVIFYEEDIKKGVLKKFIYEYENKKSCANVDVNNFRFFVGDKQSTKFPDHFFKKIFIAISVHEFEFREAMMNDVKRIMQNDGKLFIVETFYKTPAAKQRHCDRAFMLKPEFFKLMDDTGFELVNEIPLSDDINNSENGEDKIKYNNIFASFFEFKIKP